MGCCTSLSKTSPSKSEEPYEEPAADEKIEVGSAVYITSLLQRSDLNGEAGICDSFNSGNGRWVVKLILSGEQKALKSENLLLQNAVLRPGASVKLHELRRSLNLNGQMATCIRKDPTGARWVVHLLSSGDEKAVKPENLVPQLSGCQRPVAVVCDEETADHYNMKAEDLPTHWSNRHRFAGKSFDQMVYIRGEHTLDKLLATTYKSAVTQDRKCPNGVCQKIPGGCPCVQPKGDPGLPTAYEVCSAMRNEKSGMWARYMTKKELIRKKYAKCTLDSFDPPVRTCLVGQHDDTLGSLDANLNEIFVWHGCRVRDALQIAQTDFRLDFAGKAAGASLGAGIYCSDSSTKADEYSSDDPGTYYDGVFAMILCRVCMGRFLYTLDRDEGAESNVLSGDFDSVLCDREAAVNTFREFVVYDRDQIYPEYLVIYKRCYSAANDEVPPSLEFHMELPVYWRNFHRNLLVEAFNEQYRVRRSTHEILGHLSVACSSGSGLKPENLLRATRIENSRIWKRFVRFKAAVRSRHAKCTPANELDGQPDTGQVVTSAFLKAEQCTGQAVSVQNFEGSLNVYLLWHGTSRLATDFIVSDDFTIPRGGVPGLFGEGVYFAEDLRKAMQYARPEEGVQYVLLCRVCCGEMYYTEEEDEWDASEAAIKAGKDSILANPLKQGPREFVALGEEQIYPEYILEFDANHHILETE